ncbi:MAG: hypothetical protein AAFO81_12005 [Pseudomonadota bacterium]
MDFSHKDYAAFRLAFTDGRAGLNVMPKSWSWLADYIPKRTLRTWFKSNNERLLQRMYDDEAVFHKVQDGGVDIVFKD